MTALKGFGLGVSIIILLGILQPAIVSADQNIVDIKNEFINPGSFYFSFKRLWEKGLERLQFNTQSKINFYFSQFQVRIAELNYVVENKFLSEVQQSSERLAYQAGMLTDLLIEQNNNEEKQKYIKEFEKYKQSLEKLRDVYPANTSFWMLIQHDINTLEILSEKLK